MLALTIPLAGLPGGWEVWIILLIVLLLFGARLPKVARSLGQGISEFKKGLNDPHSESNGDPDNMPDAKAKQDKDESKAPS